MKIVFWLPELSMHFSAMIRALGEMGHRVTVVGQEELQPDRQTMGWFVPDFGAAEVMLAPTVQQVNDIVRGSGPDSIHILLGLRGRFYTPVLRACVRCHRRVGIHAESPHPDGLLLPLKWAFYNLQRVTRGGDVDFVLSLGRVGVGWFGHCGYARHRLFPIGYAADYVPEAVGATDGGDGGDGGGKCRILFLGRCIPIKRVDLLLRALARQSTADWLCTIAGDGPKKADWRRLAGRLGLSDRVSFIPSMSHSEAMAVLRGSDLLVLPSTHEGWGVVVNEALMSGVPAICSDRCGAADLLTEGWRGGVFRSGNVESLAEALERWTPAGTTGLELRTKIQEWSTCISSRAIAQYIVDVLEHVYGGGQKPAPPWLEASLPRDQR